jgi:hypothetical protein
MKGPGRPQTMQTAAPFTTSAARATFGVRNSGRVRNKAGWRED